MIEIKKDHVIILTYKNNLNFWKLWRKIEKEEEYTIKKLNWNEWIWYQRGY